MMNQAHLCSCAVAMKRCFCTLPRLALACLMVAWLGLVMPVQAQPLTLSALLDNAAATYPSLQAARMEARASAQDVTTAERQRWPTFSAVTENGPSTLRSYPSRSLQVEGTLWDFGRNSARV